MLRGTVGMAGRVQPRAVHLASGALPGAGAFTAQAFSSVRFGLSRVTFAVTYTQGAAGGFPQFRFQSTNGTESPLESIEDSGSLLPAQPFATVNFYEATRIGPIPQDASPLTYELTFEIPKGSTGVRLLAAELGVTATPGTIAISYAAGDP